jgi:GT2 family glycosyltransferase
MPELQVDGLMNLDILFAGEESLMYVEEDKGQYNDCQPIFWASGAALFIRSAVFHEMKGFEPFFFGPYGRNRSLLENATCGYKIYSCPKSIVYHVGGGTLPKGNPRKYS